MSLQSLTGQTPASWRADAQARAGRLPFQDLEPRSLASWQRDTLIFQALTTFILTFSISLPIMSVPVILFVLGATGSAALVGWGTGRIWFQLFDEGLTDSRLFTAALVTAVFGGVGGIAVGVGGGLAFSLVESSGGIYALGTFGLGLFGGLTSAWFAPAYALGVDTGRLLRLGAVAAIAPAALSLALFLIILGAF